MHRVHSLIIVVLSLVVYIEAFAPISSSNVASQASLSTSLDMGWFDGLLGPKGTASASHILLKGPNANDQCERIKADIYKKAVGRGNPADGVSPDKLIQAFASAAKSKSTCPSGKKGGALGTFGPGEMVPEFDAVAFKKDVGIIHGPITTDFGSHLILITEREE